MFGHGLFHRICEASNDHVYIRRRFISLVHSRHVVIVKLLPKIVVRRPIKNGCCNVSGLFRLCHYDLPAYLVQNLKNKHITK